jgi:hypothetical protein
MHRRFRRSVLSVLGLLIGLALTMVTGVGNALAEPVLVQPRNGATIIVTVSGIPATTGYGVAFPVGMTVSDTSSTAKAAWTVTASIASAPSGTSSLIGTTITTSAGDGTALLNLGITGPAGNYTLTFTATEPAPGAGSGSFTTGQIALTITPVLSINTQPASTAESGQAFTQTIAAGVTALNTLYPLEGISVTAAIASSPAGSSSLIGTTTRTSAVDGSVAFTGLGISGPPGDYTLSLSAPNATTVTSNTITVSATPDPDPDPTPSAEPTPITDESTGNLGILTLEFPAGLSCTLNNREAASLLSLWIRLPSADECTFSGSSAAASPQLLGWATRADFPLSIAERQVTNGWGAYELTNNEGQITAVFIPAGGWTAQTAPGVLFPIIDIAN